MSSSNTPRRGDRSAAESSATSDAEQTSVTAGDKSESSADDSNYVAPGADNRIAQWFKDWRQPVKHWLSRRASVPAAELDDLAQEVFVRLLRYSERTTVQNPLGYLLRIAGNVASEWRERARVARPHDQEWLDDLLIESEQEPENSVSQKHTDESVKRAVDRLPVRQRQVLLLRINEGLTYKQIAARLGLSPRIVLRDLTRAYGQLRTWFDRQDLQ